jgi:ABC-type Co2+ transport system permease subunit
MEWLPLLYQILEVCVIPLLGILTAYIVKYINVKSAEITNKVNNDTADKYIAMLADTITACVIATNQTYVEALKKQNAFTAEAQKEAFKLTYDAVMAVLTDEAKEYLTAIYGDLTAYITAKIEAAVNISKIIPAE